MQDNIVKEGPLSLPESAFSAMTKPAVARLHIPLLLMLALTILISCGSYLVFRQLENTTIQRAEILLKNIAELKRDLIKHWVLEIKSNATQSSRLSILADRLTTWKKNGGQPGADLDFLRARLKGLQQIHFYDEVTLLDLNGAVLVSNNKVLPDLTDLQPLFRRAIEENVPVIGNMRIDIRQDGAARNFRVPIAAPMITTSGAKEIAGIMVIQIDASRFLFPLIEYRSVISQTGETLLFRLEGEKWKALNRFRHGDNEPLSLVSPTNNPDRLNYQVLSGKEGLFHGADYRNEPVIGYVSRITDTDWILVTKIDEKEVYAPIKRIAAQILLVAILLLLVASLVLYLWWRRSVSRYQEFQMQLKLEKQFQQQQYEYLSRNANDIILLLDQERRVVDANERAEAAYGLGRADIIGKDVIDLRAPSSRNDMLEQWDQVKDKSSIIFEATHLRNDGTEFPVEVSSRAFRSNDVFYVQSIIRDISERKVAEKRERQQSRIYRALSETNNAIIHEANELDLFSAVCKIAVDYGGMFMAWVGIPGPDGRFVPVASHGRAIGFLDDIIVMATPDVPEGQGPGGVAFREKRPIVYQDIYNDETVMPWRNKAVQHGIRAGAAFPVLRDGKPYAIWALYSEQADAFQDEIVGLITEMVVNIGFALDNFDRDAELHKAVQASLESEARLRAAIGSMIDEIWFTDAQGNILITNDAAAKNLGFTHKGEILPSIQQVLAALEVFDPDGSPRLPEDTLVLRALRGEILQGVGELVRNIQTGELRYREVNFSPVRDVQGEIMGSVGVVRDLTDHRRAEEELKLAALVYRNSSEGMIVTDADANIIAVNPAFTSVTGYTIEEVRGKNPRFLKSGRHEKAFYEAMWHSLETSRQWQGEIWNCKKNGDIILEWLSINAVDNAGNVHGYVGLFRDITAQKEYENIIKQLSVHHVEVKEAEAKRIAREIHDDLGQRLTLLKMELLELRKEKGGQSGRLAKHLFNISNSIDDCLTTARNISSTLRPATLDIGIIPALEVLLDDFESRTRIRCTFSSEIKGDFILDDQHAIGIYRIVQESLTNVVRHAEASAVNIDLSTVENNLYMEIRDNGIGFSQSNVKEKGSYGLAGIHERARMLGGEAKIKSRLGKGTRVCVTAPLSALLKK